MSRHTSLSFLPSRFHLALRRFWKDDAGASLVEYVLLIALVAVVCIGAITLLGSNANSKLNSAAGSISGAGTTPSTP